MKDRAKVEAKLLDRDGPYCHYCSARMVTRQELAESLPPHIQGWETLGRTIDHKIPRIRGGGDEMSNLVLACTGCNGSKGTRPYLDVMFEMWEEWANDPVELEIQRQIDERLASRA